MIHPAAWPANRLGLTFPITTASFDLDIIFLLQGRDTLLPIANIVMARRQIPVRRILATRNSAVYCAGRVRYVHC